MRHNCLRSPLLVLAACLFICIEVHAASFVGKVIEINDGDEITIFNMNRPVRIRLNGIDAPESTQLFGDIARQHLSDLVYDKVVLVEYSGIGQHSSLIGRVLLNETDISAQMIRDGAAWFDARARLSDSQREIYSQSEKAARNERRGLWQTPGAVAPWEFVEAQTKGNSIKAVSTPPSEAAKSNGITRDLNSMSLLKTSGRTAQPLSVLSEMYSALDASAKSWNQLKPEGQNFSVFIPKGGLQKTRPMSFMGGSIDINTYTVRDGYSIYELMWATGPDQSKTDVDAIQSALTGVYKGMNAAFSESRLSTAFECEPASERSISSGGYAGREFDLTSCPIRGMARIYTRVIGDQRQIYLGYVFSNEMDEKVSRFINSFKITVPKSAQRK